MTQSSPRSLKGDTEEPVVRNQFSFFFNQPQEQFQLEVEEPGPALPRGGPRGLGESAVQLML